VFWLKDKSLTDLDNLPEPDDLAEEVIDNLEAGLASFRTAEAGLEAARLGMLTVLPSWQSGIVIG